MKLIASASHALHGLVRVPGDKSISHRAALLGALAEGESSFENFLDAGVTRPLLGALNQLGIRWELDGGSLKVWGQGLHGFKTPGKPIDCGNSATVLRLLTGAIAAAGIPASLGGTDGLRRRPMSRIVDPLITMGVPIEASPSGTAPITLRPRSSDQSLNPVDYTIPVSSAQVKSCLLLAALSAGGPVTLTEPSLSRDHTERMLRNMAVRVDETIIGGSHTVTLTPPLKGKPSPIEFRLPGDFSSAAFFIVAATIVPGSSLVIEEVGLNPTRTGLLDALQRMGADIRISNRHVHGCEPVGDIQIVASPLHGIRINGDLVVRMIDEFPAFAVAAAYAQGETTVLDAIELRYKESDRISAIGKELRLIGISFEEIKDGFTIFGGLPVGGGEVQPSGDHRIAMSLAIAGLAAEAPVSIQGIEIVNESFPGFINEILSIGGDIKLEP